jgi:hypothetical protein
MRYSIGVHADRQVWAVLLGRANRQNQQRVGRRRARLVTCQLFE